MKMKYQTATTEQKAGQVDDDGKPLSPNPPDDSGEWQLIGLHAFLRYEPTPAVSKWFVHFYWQRAIVEPTATVRPPPTPMPNPMMSPSQKTPATRGYQPSHMIKGGYQPPSSTNEKISPTSFPVGGSPSEQPATVPAPATSDKK